MTEFFFYPNDVVGMTENAVCFFRFIVDRGIHYCLELFNLVIYATLSCEIILRRYILDAKRRMQSITLFKFSRNPPIATVDT